MAERPGVTDATDRERLEVIRRYEQPFDRREILGRLRVVEQGKKTRLERDLLSRLEAAEADARQMRAALEEIADVENWTTPRVQTFANHRPVDIARAALDALGRA